MQSINQTSNQFVKFNNDMLFVTINIAIIYNLAIICNLISEQLALETHMLNSFKICVSRARVKSGNNLERICPYVRIPELGFYAN